MKRKTKTEAQIRHLKRLQELHRGSHQSPETIEKRRQKMLGRTHSPESKERMREAALRRAPISEVTRAKIAANSTGRVPSSEMRKKLSDMFSGSKHPQWKGGVVINSDGYRYIRMKVNGRNRYVLEHRLVMEKVLGRPLLAREVVHHIDENKLNNQPENLRLFASAYEHTRHHEELRRSTKSVQSTKE